MSQKMQEFQELYERIKTVEAKELLGLPLLDKNKNKMLEQQGTYLVENDSITLAEINIQLSQSNTCLLKRIKQYEQEALSNRKKYEAKIASLEAKYEAKIASLEAKHERELVAEKKRFEKALKVATNEKASNLEIRKLIDRLPGEHYQLSEKTEILKVLVDLANRLYKIKAYVEVMEDSDGEVLSKKLNRDCETRYNLSKVAEYVSQLIEMHET